MTLCRQFLSDGHLSNEEIEIVRKWLGNNRRFASTWPGDVVIKRIDLALSDGFIDADERRSLTESLESLVSGADGNDTDTSAPLPLDDIQLRDVRGLSFCFAGHYVYGSRVSCERATRKAGGQCSRLLAPVTDYLVVGSRIGRKWHDAEARLLVDDALALRRNGSAIGIIHEETWSRALPISSLIWCG